MLFLIFIWFRCTVIWCRVLNPDNYCFESHARHKTFTLPTPSPTTSLKIYMTFCPKYSLSSTTVQREPVSSGVYYFHYPVYDPVKRITFLFGYCNGNIVVSLEIICEVVFFGRFDVWTLLEIKFKFSQNLRKGFFISVNPGVVNKKSTFPEFYP